MGRDKMLKKRWRMICCWCSSSSRYSELSYFMGQVLSLEHRGSHYSFLYWVMADMYGWFFLGCG